MTIDIWEDLDKMRKDLTDNTHISRKALEAMLDAHKAVVAERDALALYVARLRGLGQLVREAATDMGRIGTEELFDRAEKWDAALEDEPATILALAARLRESEQREQALARAEALEWAVRHIKDGMAREFLASNLADIECEADMSRRRAEAGR